MITYWYLSDLAVESDVTIRNLAVRYSLKAKNVNMMTLTRKMTKMFISPDKDPRNLYQLCNSIYSRETNEP